MVHIVSKPPEINFLFKELKNYGKSYNNVHEIKKAILSNDS